jgi:hypothetical protein
MIELRIHDDGKTQAADAPDDCSTREFLVEVVRVLHPGSNVQEWDLKDGPDGKSLRLDQTLKENHVRALQDLYLVSKVRGLEQEKICSKCQSVNVAGAKFCAHCGSSLRLPQADRDRQDGQPERDLSIEVSAPDKQSRHCEVAADTPTAEFVADLVEAFELPKVDVQNHPMVYLLFDEQSQRGMDSTKTLAENGIHSGHRLMLKGSGDPGRETRTKPHVTATSMELPQDDFHLEVTAPDKRHRRCEAAPDTPTSEFVADLVEAFELPKVDAKNHPMVYSLFDEQSQRVMDSTKTLAQNGLVRGHRLLLRSSGDPGKQPLRSTTIHLEDLRLEVAAPGKRPRRSEVAPYTPTAEFLADLVEAFELPKVDAKNRPIVYLLSDQQTQRVLTLSKTLIENNVATGARLMVKARERTGFEQFVDWMGARAIPILVTLIALIVAIALIWAAFHYLSHPERKTKVLPVMTSTQPAATVAEPAATIAVNPPTLNVSQSGTVKFTASVEHSSNQAVEWSINPPVGSISADGTYSAPASIPEQQDVEIIASSAADPKVSGKAVVTLLPAATDVGAATSGAATGTSGNAPALRITPAAVNLDASETRQFSVTPMPENPVHWSLKPQLGSISQRGLYAAPPLVSQEQHVTVIADSGSPGIAKITLQPVAVSAITSTKDPNGAMTFTATVTHTKNSKVAWSISPQTGSISPLGVYTPASRVNAPFDLTVTARSLADPSKFAQLAVNIVQRASSVRVILNPFNPVLTDNQRQMLAATVTGASDRSVTWAMVGPGKIMPDGLYIAPQHIPPGDHAIHITATSNADPSKSAEGEFILRHASYSGPEQGTLVWSGNIEKNKILTIDSSQASSGTVTGSLPGVPVVIHSNTAQLTILSAPAQSNGWKSIVIRTGAHLHSISIDWRVAP